MKTVKRKLLQGNEACAEGALAAGVRFFAGYPITPSTEIAEIMAAKLPRLGGRFLQMEDEIAGMAAIIGASLAGTKSLTATSGPGFSLKQENFGYAIMTETPCVVVDVQRGGPSTGLPTSPSQGDVMQARWGTHGSHPVIALSPASVRETFDLTVKAVNFSEKFRLPVVLLLDEVIGHMREAIELPDYDEIEIIDRKKPQVPPEEYLPYKADEDGVPPMANFGDGYRFHVTGLTHDETGFPSNKPDVSAQLIKRLNDKIEKHKDEIIITEGYQLEDAEVVIFCYGCVARSAKRAVKEARESGKKVGLLRTATIWPFPAQVLQKSVKDAKYVLVPEMNEGQLLEEVERAIGCKLKVEGLNKINGELITPSEILEKIGEVI
ncbi:MAG: 2-oxoglutarate/2-oxoacid ferredoxin oxidoreductase subunit alpha [Clostridia bacterium]|jgi:2-oxoglutarate ferredoxin oxidoreductase subunit alpha|nr:2-oxoglutarate synthase [Clostridiales bacterium]MDK2984811.1 2-oxoglutarate/2-oxoacid ferredoxin oxidoreductase subunit alpha [Clostridia bacterium]